MPDTLLAERPAHVPPERVIDWDIYNPPGAAAGFHESWLKLHEPGVPDLVWTPRNGGHWLATRGKLITELYSDYERFSNRTMLVPKLTMEDGRDARHIVPSYLDPPRHRPYRNLLNTSFAPKTIKAMESRIRTLVIDLIERFRARGHCDFITEFSEILPIEIFLNMVDLPLSDAPMLKSWAEMVTIPDTTLTLEQSRAKIAGMHAMLHDYLWRYIQERRGKEGSDLFSVLIAGQIEGRGLTESEMIDMCTQIMFGGLDTVVNFTAFVMHYLATHPEERRAIAADPSLELPAIDEMLRRFPVVIVGREVVADTVVDGLAVMQGEMIMGPTMLVGLDDRLNEDPLEVRLDRRSAEHITFGSGPHRCAGASLARMEVRVVMQEWLKRIPEFGIAPGATITYRGGNVGRMNAPLPLVWTPL